jgi:hypothetical protein
MSKKVSELAFRIEKSDERDPYHEMVQNSLV